MFRNTDTVHIRTTASTPHGSPLQFFECWCYTCLVSGFPFLFPLSLLAGDFRIAFICLHNSQKNSLKGPVIHVYLSVIALISKGPCLRQVMQSQSWSISSEILHLNSGSIKPPARANITLQAEGCLPREYASLRIRRALWRLAATRRADGHLYGHGELSHPYGWRHWWLCSCTGLLRV